jgi:RHS repeat-associated protein
VTKIEPFKDDFNDGNYTGWSVSSGAWDASNHYLTCTGSEGEITKANSDGSSDLWFSYYDGDTSSTAYYATVYLRYNSSSYLWLKIFRDKMDLFEYVAATCDTEEVNTTLDTNSNATTSQGVWYDVYARYNGASIQVWRAQRGSGNEMAQVLSTSSATVTSTSKFAFHAYGSWRFDDLRMVSDSLSSTTTYTYFDANKLTTSTSPSDGNMTYEYDAWGRMVTKNLQSGAHIAAYTYRYDSKLCTVTSSIPDESNVTNNYDGTGKLRSITTGGATKKLRWDAGWHPINLEDANGNLATTFVHDPAREAAGSVLAAHVGSNPESGGTWAYLSQDHLGSTRHVRGQDRASLGTYEFTPYGDPYITTGMDLPQKFTGHWQIPQAGVYYAPYRIYAPGFARWLTRDPLGMVDAPNVYEYVRGNPVLFTDPDGEELTLALVAGLAEGLTATLAALGIEVTFHPIGNALTAAKTVARRAGSAVSEALGSLWSINKAINATAAYAAISAFEAAVDALKPPTTYRGETVVHGWVIQEPHSEQGRNGTEWGVKYKHVGDRVWRDVRLGPSGIGSPKHPNDPLERGAQRAIDKYLDMIKWPGNRFAV